MRNVLQNLVSTLILLVGISFIFFYKPVYSGMPKGVVLPLSDFLPAIPIQKVNVEDEQPKGAREVGQINLELNGIVPTNEAEILLLNRARELTASVGANTLYVQQVGHTEQNQFGFSIYYFRAIAMNK